MSVQATGGSASAVQVPSQGVLRLPQPLFENVCRYLDPTKAAGIRSVCSQWQSITPPAGLVPPTTFCRSRGNPRGAALMAAAELLDSRMGSTLLEVRRHHSHILGQRVYLFNSPFSSDQRPRNFDQLSAAVTALGVVQAITLVHFFARIAREYDLGEFPTTLDPNAPVEDRARQIRTWMQCHGEQLSTVDSLNWEWDPDHIFIPEEVVLLRALINTDRFAQLIMDKGSAIDIEPTTLFALFQTETAAADAAFVLCADKGRLMAHYRSCFLRMMQSRKFARISDLALGRALSRILGHNEAYDPQILSILESRLRLRPLSENGWKQWIERRDSCIMDLDAVSWDILDRILDQAPDDVLGALFVQLTTRHYEGIRFEKLTRPDRLARLSEERLIEACRKERNIHGDGVDHSRFLEVVMQESHRIPWTVLRQLQVGARNPRELQIFSRAMLRKAFCCCRHRP